MGSQSKHLKPVSWTPSVSHGHRNPKEPCVHLEPSQSHRRTDGRRPALTESASVSAGLDCFSCESRRWSATFTHLRLACMRSLTAQLLWDQPSSSRRPPSHQSQNYRKPPMGNAHCFRLSGNEQREIKNRATEFRKRWCPGTLNNTSSSDGHLLP